MNKHDLRQLYLEKRASLPVSQAVAASGKIADRFFENIDLASIRELHTFIRIAKFNEIDTSVLYYRLWRDFPQIRTSAPRTDITSGKIESASFDARTDWAENAWGIREPLRTVTVGPAEIDIVLVPLLCFDENGHRVGYGKGMYDRFLARCRSDCLKVGLSYFPSVESIDGVLASDVRLDLCVTPGAVFSFGENISLKIA